MIISLSFLYSVKLPELILCAVEEYQGYVPIQF